MAIMAAAAIIGAGVSIYSAVDSANKKKKAQEGLDDWNKSNRQSFKTGQQIYQEAELSTPYGYSPQERAAFQQNMARRSNKAYQMATERNPNLSPQINAAINYGNIQGLINFAASDAALRRGEIARKAGMIGDQDNRQVAFNQQVAGQYGQAIQQQQENINASLYNVANSVGAYGYYKGKKDGDDGDSGGGIYDTKVDTNTYQGVAPNTDNMAYQKTAKPISPPGTIWDTSQFFSTPYSG